MHRIVSFAVYYEQGFVGSQIAEAIEGLGLPRRVNTTTSEVLEREQVVMVHTLSFPPYSGLESAYSQMRGVHGNVLAAKTGGIIQGIERLSDVSVSEERPEL